jgi:hypothetical protein
MRRLRLRACNVPHRAVKYHRPFYTWPLQIPEQRESVYPILQVGPCGGKGGVAAERDEGHFVRGGALDIGADCLACGIVRCVEPI